MIDVTYLEVSTREEMLGLKLLALHVDTDAIQWYLYSTFF